MLAVVRMVLVLRRIPDGTNGLTEGPLASGDTALDSGIAPILSSSLLLLILPNLPKSCDGGFGCVCSSSFAEMDLPRRRPVLNRVEASEVLLGCGGSVPDRRTPGIGGAGDRAGDTGLAGVVALSALSAEVLVLSAAESILDSSDTGASGGVLLLSKLMSEVPVLSIAALGEEIVASKPSAPFPGIVLLLGGFSGLSAIAQQE